MYIPIDKLELNNENTYLLNNTIRAINWLDKDRLLLPQLDALNKKYIVLRQFWSVCPPIPETVNFFN